MLSPSQRQDFTPEPAFKR
jgi:CRP-like cAMP-binding protein